jgi:hypothetical protein
LRSLSTKNAPRRQIGEHEVLMNINTLAILGGSLSARALGLATWVTVRSQARMM